MVEIIKESMFITCLFSFSFNVFSCLFHTGHQPSGLHNKVLIISGENEYENIVENRGNSDNQYLHLFCQKSAFFKVDWTGISQSTAYSIALKSV